MSHPPKGDVIAYVLTVLQPGDIAVDGGANLGGVSEVMAKAVGPSGLVYAIEPDRRCHDALAQLSERFSQVRVQQVALTAKPGTIPFVQAVGSAQSSLVEAAVTEQLAIEQVWGMRLDDLVAPPVALVKLDLQGGEYAALQGASSLLRACHRWVVEVWPSVLKSQGVRPEAFWGLFASYGLTGYSMDPVVLMDEAQFVKWWHDTPRFVNLIFQR